MSKSFKPIPEPSKKVEEMTVKDAEDYVNLVFSNIASSLPESRGNLENVAIILHVFCKDEKKPKVEAEDPKAKRLKIANEFAMRKVSRYQEKDEDG